MSTQSQVNTPLDAAGGREVSGKAVVRRFYELVQEYWRTGDVDVFDRIAGPNFVHHGPGLPPDLAGLKQALPMFRAAMPDLRFSIDELIAEGDKVADRITVQATHRGDFMGIPPTGRRVTFTEMHIARIEGDRIAERWSMWDMMGVLQQLNAAPAAEAATNS